MSAHLTGRAQAQWDADAFLRDLGGVFPPATHSLTPDDVLDMPLSELSEWLTTFARTCYEDLEAKLTPEVAGGIAQQVMLRAIDHNWVQHLTAMMDLRESVGLYAYGQRDPLVMYKKEGHDKFLALQDGIQNAIVRTIYHAFHALASGPGANGTGTPRRAPGRRQRDGPAGRHAIAQGPAQGFGEGRAQLPLSLRQRQEVQALLRQGRMNNQRIAEVFDDIAGLLEIKGEKVFTVRAYQRAGRTISRLPAELETMLSDGEDLRQIPGIGKAISDKIGELVDTNRMRFYDNLKAEFPEGMLDLMRVPGLGPKTISRAWKELGVTSVAELEMAASDGRLASLPRLGQKTADNILRSIQFAKTKDQRTPIADALPAAERIVAALLERNAGILALMPAGSLRRFEETVGDLDLVCATHDAESVLADFVALPGVAEVLGHGGTKASVLLDDGLQVDFRAVPPRQYGSLLQYFTGSQHHNILLREHANRLGLSLSEYGIAVAETGVLEEFADEESVYGRLGLQYVPPELRAGESEVAMARECAIPSLVQVEDLRGDLHVHTDWSDGRDPIEVMVAAARRRGHEYVAITDHSAGLGVANGPQPGAPRQPQRPAEGVGVRRGRHRRACAAPRWTFAPTAAWTIPTAPCRSSDWVVASVHSAMNQQPHVMTERILSAMRNPYVTAIGHLTTRLIGRRQPIDADFDTLFRAAADTGTVLEINASLERLDLKDSHVRRARELGATLVINSDAHTADHLDNLRFGAAVARRGWCRAEDVLNTLPAAELLDLLRLPKPERARAIRARR